MLWRHSDTQLDLSPYWVGERHCMAQVRPDFDQASLPGDHRALEPPDPIPNSVVKRCIADGSVGLPHVRVGHRQASKKENPPIALRQGVLFFGMR